VAQAIRLPGELACDGIAASLTEWLAGLQSELAPGLCIEIAFESRGELTDAFTRISQDLSSKFWVSRIFGLDAGVPIFHGKEDLPAIFEFVHEHQHDLTIAPISGLGSIGITTSKLEKGCIELLLVTRGDFQAKVKQMKSAHPQGVVFKGN
jgi:hypothetical protein